METRFSYLRGWLPKDSSPVAQLSAFFAFAIAVSMTFSPFVLSLAMWGLVFTAWWQAAIEIQTARPGSHLWQAAVWWRGLVHSFRRFFSKPLFWLPALLLLVPALSGLWSDDGRYWLERTRVRLPFFVIAWAFANLPPLGRQHYRFVIYGLVVALTLICIGVGVNYLLHQQEIMFALKEGRAIPVPRHHIRFNLILATGILSGGWLWFTDRTMPRGWRLALALMLLFLFGFIHFLSVRSGLAALYAALLFAAGWLLIRRRRWGLGLALLALLAAAPWVAMKTIPSLEQKISYMRWDWGQFRAGKGAQYSDSERWVSLRSGWDIFRQHPWLGVGAGDLPAALQETTTRLFPSYEAAPRLPHNQWLYIAAGTGLFGLALSAAAFYYPLFIRTLRRNYLFMALQVMLFVSFMVEYTLETAIGVAWYLFFSLWFAKQAFEQPE